METSKSASKLPFMDDGGMNYVHHERPPPYNPYYAEQNNRHNDYGGSGCQPYNQIQPLIDKPIVPRRLYFGTDGGSVRLTSRSSRRSVPNLRSFVDRMDNEADFDPAQAFATSRRSSFTSSARQHRQGHSASLATTENTPLQTNVRPIFQPATVPSASNDRSTQNSVKLTGIRQVAQFGCFTEDTGPAGSFIHPTRISVAPDGSVVVVDSQYMTIHVFNANFAPFFMLRVIGAQGAHLLLPDKLVVATHRGLQIVNWHGQTLKKIDCGSVLNIVPLSLGFLICQPQAVVCFNSLLVEVKRTKKAKYGKILPRNYRFRNITDVAVSKSEELLGILDAGSFALYVTDEHFSIKLRIKLNEHLRTPTAVIFDTFKRVLIADCDTSRIVQFSTDGRLLNYLFNDVNSVVRKRCIPHGLALHGNNLLVVLTGHRFAQVNVYAML